MGKKKQQHIDDLESEVRELRGFSERGRKYEVEALAIFHHVYAQHQPKVVKTQGQMRLELRCRRCTTDENHTWSNDNYLPWPCPTIAPFVATAKYEEVKPDEHGMESPLQNPR